jgi:hypothetical protein
MPVVSVAESRRLEDELEGPGKGPAGKLIIAVAVLGLFVGSILLLYTLLKIWPHPTPSGAPVDAGAASAQSPVSAQSDNSAGPTVAVPPAARGVGGPLTCDTTIVARVYVIAPDSLRDPECVSLFAREFPIWAEQRLLLIVVLSGALGGMLHAARSLVWYVGNRTLKRSWLPYYLSLPLAGGVMALAFYVVLRGGLFSPSSSIRETSPFGFAAMAFLVGMFSPQAALKLKQVAGTLLAEPGAGEDATPQAAGGTPAERSLPAAATIGAAPQIAGLEPPTVIVGKPDQVVTIMGSGFVPESQVRIGSSMARPPTGAKTATTLQVLLAPEDLQSAGSIEIRVINPPASGGESSPMALAVVGG